MHSKAQSGASGRKKLDSLKIAAVDARVSCRQETPSRRGNDPCQQPGAGAQLDDWKVSASIGCSPSQCRARDSLKANRSCVCYSIQLIQSASIVRTTLGLRLTADDLAGLSSRAPAARLLASFPARCAAESTHNNGRGKNAGSICARSAASTLARVNGGRHHERHKTLFTRDGRRIRAAQISHHRPTPSIDSSTRFKSLQRARLASDLTTSSVRPSTRTSKR